MVNEIHFFSPSFLILDFLNQLTCPISIACYCTKYSTSEKCKQIRDAFLANLHESVKRMLLVVEHVAEVWNHMLLFRWL